MLGTSCRVWILSDRRRDILVVSRGQAIDVGLLGKIEVCPLPTLLGELLSRSENAQTVLALYEEELGGRLRRPASAEDLEDAVRQVGRAFETGQLVAFWHRCEGGTWTTPKPPQEQPEKEPSVEAPRTVRLSLRVALSARPLSPKSGGPGKPVPFRLSIEGRIIDGQTDAGGLIEVSDIPADATEGTLHILGRRFKLRIQTLDPKEEVTGLQARLNNLGYHAGPIDGELGPQTRQALRAFQARNRLRTDGEPSDETLARLEELTHG